MRRGQKEGVTYAGVEADGLLVNAQAGELDQLLELDGQRRHDAGVAENQVVRAVVKSMLLASRVKKVVDRTACRDQTGTT